MHPLDHDIAGEEEEESLAFSVTIDTLMAFLSYPQEHGEIAKAACKQLLLLYTLDKEEEAKELVQHLIQLGITLKENSSPPLDTPPPM